MTTPPTTAAPDTVDTDLDCRRCGYNLRTRAWSSICPECALSVAASRLPQEFNFTQWRDLRRFRTALVILISSMLVAAVANIQFTLYLRYQHWLKGLSYWYWTSVACWIYGTMLSQCATSIAVALAMWRFIRSEQRGMGLLSGLSVAAATIHITTQLGTEIIWPFRLTGSLTEFQATALTAPAALSAGCLIGMLPIALMKAINRSTSPRTYWALALAIPFFIATGAILAMMTFLGLIEKAVPLSLINQPGKWQDSIKYLWMTDWLGWSQHQIRDPLKLTIVAFLALILRRLNSPLRADNASSHHLKVSSGSGEPQS